MLLLHRPTHLPTAPHPLSSVAASLGGVSLDTTMGFSPLEGLLMGVRAGDLDPTVVPYMARRLGVGEAEVLRRVGEEGGFLGIAGTPDSKWARRVTMSLSRELEDRMEAGDALATLAIDMFCYRVAK